MATVRFKTRDGWIQFKARKTSGNPVRRSGSWPKGKTPAHLKKFLFKKSRRSRR